MHQSVTSALDHVRERTAGPGSEWESATITDIAPRDTPDLDHAASLPDMPSHLRLTATLQDGTELSWKCAMPWAEDVAESDAVLSHLMTDTDNGSVGDSVIGETVWVRQRYASTESVSGGSPRWDTTGQWLLESSGSRQRWCLLQE
jgi:hypothetical protein